MRLSTEKILQGILHSEQAVRDAALSYFATAFSEDRAAMMRAAEAIETYGCTDAFSDVDLLLNLAQSDQSVNWLLKQAVDLGTPVENWHWDYLATLSWILAHADAGLLKRRRKDVLEMPFLHAVARTTIETKTRLLSIPADVCWATFEECCQTLAAGAERSGEVLGKAYDQLDVVARHPEKYAAKILALLSEDIDREQDLARAWMQACAIRGAATMRLLAAIPQLVQFLQQPREAWIHEDCVMGLIRIGGADTVKAVWNACATGPPGFHEHASWVLESVHTDLAVEAASHLLENVEDPSAKAAFGYAVLTHFDVDGATRVRRLLHEYQDDEQIQGLREPWVAVCRLLEVDFPEIIEWTQASSDDGSADLVTDQWQVPEFPVVDTWAAQLAAQPPAAASGAKPQQPAPSAPKRLPPIRLPRLHKASRNDLCPCESGKKYKNCCMRK